jgi:hypothetical protein
MAYFPIVRPAESALGYASADVCKVFENQPLVISHWPLAKTNPKEHLTRRTRRET